MSETWEGCYDGGWNGLIVPEAYQHPAKMSRALVRRIFNELDLPKGSLIVDPFGGIGSTGIEAASRGLRAVLVELEPKFVALAGQNFALNAPWWERMGYPMPVIVQGDSRELRRHVAGSVDCVVSSPPFQGVLNDAKMQVPHDTSGNFTKDYGTTEGQLGAMPAGSVDVVVSSPPFTPSSGGGGINRYGYTGENAKPHHMIHYQGSAAERADGNLEALPLGDVDAIVGSPPFSPLGSQPLGGLPSTPVSSKLRALGIEKRAGEEYGDTPGQLGAMPAGDVDDYLTPTYYRGILLPCETPAATAELISEGPANAADRVRTSMLANSSKDDLSQQATEPESLPPDTTSQHQKSGEKVTLTGRAATRVGAATLGASNEERPLNETEASVSAAALTNTSKSITSAVRNLPAEHGTTISETSKPYAPDATSGTIDQGVDSAQKKQGHGISNRDGAPLSDSMRSESQPSPANSAEPSFAVEADPNSAPTRASGQTVPHGNDSIGPAVPSSFWEAAAVILDQCYAVLKPGGIAVWVCKDFIRRGKRVPFTDDWVRLCESRGFVLERRARAMLVKEQRGGHLFDGEHVTRKKRASFFRLLYERKYPHNAIDWEDVVFLRRPL